jgi:hypothetical protein
MAVCPAFRPAFRRGARNPACRAGNLAGDHPPTRSPRTSDTARTLIQPFSFSNFQQSDPGPLPPALYPVSAMGRHCDSGSVDLPGIFRHVQSEMLSHLAAGELFEHPTAAGAVTEQHWLALFDRYLPQRYRAASVFVIDAQGHRSRQIDLAVFDRLYTPPLFPHAAGLHIPAESVYAVFEVKQDLNQRLLRDAGRKAASVRRLLRTSVPVLAAGALRRAIRPHRILAGILALRSGWPTKFHLRLPTALARLAADESLDLGIALRDGAFESGPKGQVRFSTPAESLIFFLLRLLTRLQSLGTAPAADLMAYGRNLESFAKR